jgi:hypothetical protein
MASVFIGLPMHDGGISAFTMSSVQDAIARSQHKIAYQTMGLSLLARNFTTLWLNAYRAGYDFFLLHHTDLGVAGPPNQSWIDVLVDRLYQLNAAVVSVVSPIKSAAGHTSFGLDLEAGNHYTLRRVTVRELAMLPREFISKADLCELFGLTMQQTGAMIVNTGCMLMDLRRFDWCGMRWPGFQIKDELIWSPDGSAQAFTSPEDWEFSRWMHSRGIPFFATRELLLNHAGTHVFQNAGRWGELEDNTPKQVSKERFSAGVTE